MTLRPHPNIATAETQVPAPDRSEDDVRREGLIYLFFVAQAIGLIILQKMAIGGVELTLFLFLGGFAVTIWLGIAQIDFVRLNFYALFFVSAVLSALIAGTPFSAPSMLLVLGIYLPLVIRFDGSAALYRRCLRFYITIMLVMGVIGALEMAVQVVWGWRVWPDFEHWVPQALLYPGFNYHRSFGFQSPWMQPNAIFFLEPSILAQMLALALLAELVTSGRMIVMAVLLVAQVLTFAGTGLMLLGICSPFLLFLFLRRTPALIPLLVIGAVGALASGWGSQVLDRLSEFGQAGTSANGRFIAPFWALVDGATRPGALLSGLGAGTSNVSQIILPWASTKLVVEYGLVTAVLFHIFFIDALFRGSPSKLLSFAALICFSILGGGLAVPMYPLLCALLCSLLRIERPANERHAFQGWSAGRFLAQRRAVQG